MNIQRIEYVIKQIEQSKNYKDFTKLLSLEERKQFINFLLSETEESINFMDEHPILNDENFAGNLFTEDEAEDIYNNEFNELNENFKGILICNLKLDLAKEEMKKNVPNIDFIRLVLRKMSSDDEKVKFIETYFSNLSNKDKFDVFVGNLEKINFKLWLIKLYSDGLYSSVYSKYFYENTNDEELKKIIEFFNQNPNLSFKYDYIFNKILIDLVSKLKNVDLKLEYLDTFTNDFEKAQIIASLKDDDLKIKYLNILSNDSCKFLIISSFNDDNLKVKYLNILSDSVVPIGAFNKVDVITNFKDDNLKLNYLNILSDSDKALIIESIKDLKIKIKALTFLNPITSYCLNHDWLDKVENTNDDINKEIIKKISLENNLNYDNLFKLFLKLGYGIRTLGNNLEKIVNLKEDEFAKIMQIIDTLKSSKLTMDDVKNFLPTFYERDFRINNKNVILTFSNLKDLIEIKDKKKISDILFEINKNIDINNILIKYNFNLDTFIDNLLKNGKNENLLNILHEITDEYLDKMRALYTAERKKSAENELNLDFNFDKNYLISKLFKKYDVQYIYEFINRLINKDKLDDNQKEFLNNESLLIECLKFMKNKENYPRENFPKIQNKLKLLNGILNKLYEDKKLDFLGNIKDEDAKIILKPKEVIANSFFIKLLSELDIDLIENKLLNNHELYEKLLNNIKKYKFMNWTDTFKNILEKADFSFLEMDIAIFINYFYDFYPKLEKEQQEKGRKVSLSNILDEIRTYGSSSVKYNYLLGKEDSDFIISNPTPNSSGLKVEERLKKVSEEILIQFERKYITIPPMDSDISLKNGKKIHVDIGDITSAINLTYGERTGACMRIGGAGSSLFDFCLENENGFHVRFTNPITGNFVSRVSGFRNGNTIFLNQLRESLDKNISNSDLIDAVSMVARQIVESTKDSKYPIKNVVISDGVVMKRGDKTTLNVSDVKEGYNNFYSDVSRTNAIYLEKNAEIELGPEKSERYDILRKKIKKFNNFKEINEQIQKFNLINGLLKGQSLGDISLIDENTIMNVNELYVGEDFLIAVDINHNILWKHILERDSCFTLKANEEINVLLNYLSEKSIINEGEKSR